MCCLAAAQVSFQQKKRRRRLVEANLEGQTLDDDLDGNFEADKREYLQKEASNRHERLNTQAKRKASMKIQRPLKFDFAGLVAFLSPKLGAADKASVANANVRCTEDRERATVFVTDDFEDVGQRVLWNVVLRGGAIMTPDYLISKGCRGNVCCYNPAIKLSRRIWVSVDFADKHPILSSILERAVQSRASAWTWEEGTLADFLALRRRVGAHKSVIGIVTVEEKSHQDNCHALANPTAHPTHSECFCLRCDYLILLCWVLANTFSA